MKKPFRTQPRNNEFPNCWQMYIKIYRLSSIFTRCIVVSLVGSMLLYNLSPIYHNYSVGAFSLQARRSGNISSYAYSVYYLYPGFDPDDHFVIVTIFNLYLSWSCALSVLGLDLLLCLMVFEIVAHIKLLKAALHLLGTSSARTDAPLQSRRMLTLSENRRVHKEIKQCIIDHIEIVQFAAEMSNFFGPVMGLNYMLHLVSCCLVLLECSTYELTALIRFGALAVITFSHLILLSTVIEVVDTESEMLSEVVYSTPWELMDASNRSMVRLLLQRVQTTIHVTAFGVTPVGVRTMAGILKTTFSYYAVLQSLN